MGNTCKFMADSCQCMTKPTTVLWSDWPPTSKMNEGKKKDYFTQPSVECLIHAVS